MQFKISRQTTTGLVINKKVNIKNDYYRKARSMCNQLFTAGNFYLLPEQKGSEQPPSINKLEGILSFIYKIKRPHDEATTGSRRNNPHGITKLYRHFLFYKHFYSNNMPLIICEGKTDIIYLKCALEILGKDYPSLVDTKDSKPEFKIKFLNLTKNLRDVLSISNGAPGIESLMDIYKTNMKKFKNKKFSHPIIILTDNDEGAKKIKKQLGIAEEGFIKNYYHYHKNLYVIPSKSKIPKEEEHNIEDLFDKKILNTKIDKKTFKRNNCKMSDNEYSKIVFAHKVIKAQKDSINFNAFRPIFDSFLDIINYQNN